MGEGGKGEKSHYERSRITKERIERGKQRRREAERKGSREGGKEGREGRT